MKLSERIGCFNGERTEVYSENWNEHMMIKRMLEGSL